MRLAVRRAAKQRLTLIGEADMGVEYGAKIMVGLPVDEMECDDEGYWDESGVLEFCPDGYGYDSPSGVVGIEVGRSGTYSYREILPEALLESTKAAKESFKEACGKEAKVYLCTYGY
jgi:hypothetical protein